MQAVLSSEACDPVKLTGHSMGTTWCVQFTDSDGSIDLGRLNTDIQTSLDLIVDQMSTWAHDSVISSLNRAPAGWYQLPEPFFSVMQCALDVANATDGAYDPTIGPLVDLWGFGPAGPRSEPPPGDAILAAMTLTGREKTRLNVEHRGVWQPGGLAFDLSSIAKGYGADSISAVLNGYGIRNHLVELGGEIMARGTNHYGKRWEIQIEAPDHRPGAMPIALSDYALATSGDYRRHFVHEGRQYAHTLDPRTGYPLTHRVVCVSVVHRQCMLADAWATALLCMGPDRGLEYARTHDVPAVFMLREESDIVLEWTDALVTLAQP